MRIKATALLLSALLPLSVMAMPEQGQQQGRQQSMQGQSNQQLQNNPPGNKSQKASQWKKGNMQQRQAAWFERLNLTAEQRELFEKEMAQRHAEQMQARAAHHDKLRAVLTEEQRVIFDQDISRMEQRMQRYMQKRTSSSSAKQAEQKRGQRNSTQ